MKVKYSLVLQYEKVDQEIECCDQVDLSSNHGICDLYDILTLICMRKFELDHVALHAVTIPDDDDNSSIILQDPVLSEYDWRESLPDFQDHLDHLSANDLPFPDVEDLAASEEVFGEGGYF